MFKNFVHSRKLLPIYILAASIFCLEANFAQNSEEQILPQNTTPKTESSQSSNTEAVLQPEASNDGESDAANGEEANTFRLEEESALTFNDPNGTVSSESPTSIRSLLRAVLSLGVVLLLIFGVLYAIKRLGKKKNSSSIISVLTIQTVQNSRNLLIVSIADSLYFMSSSEAGIQLISEITDEETKKFIKTNAQAEPGRPFANLLAKYFPDQKKDNAIHTQLQGLRKQSERLKHYD